MSQELDAWVKNMNAQSLPAFARTIREVSSVATSSASSARDLSEVVSRDAAVTARLIQVVNSALFNLQGGRIDSVNAAVVMLGFDAVRELAVSLSVLDDMLKSDPLQQVGGLMAQGFHAAAQAKGLTRLMHAGRDDEVFVAALLKNLGPMAFWSKGQRDAQALLAAVQQGEPAAQAEQRILGFRLTDLGQRLAEEWNLGELALQSHRLQRKGDDLPSETVDTPVACIHLGHTIAEQTDAQGIDGRDLERTLQRIVARFGVAEEALEDTVRANADIAAKVAERFGVDPKLLRQLKPTVGPADTTTSQVVIAQNTQNVLERLAEGFEEGWSRDQLLRTMVDGVVESCAAQHCYFALLSADRQQLVMKYACPEQEVQALALTAGGILVEAITCRKLNTVDVPQQSPWHAGGTGLVAGVHLGNKPVGVVYGEWADASQAAQQFSAFRQIAQQTALILTQPT
ncbi:MAG: HDOD domain-containing protein [Pseudomonadota bacterium]